MRLRTPSTVIKGLILRLLRNCNDVQRKCTKIETFKLFKFQFITKKLTQEKHAYKTFRMKYTFMQIQTVLMIELIVCIKGTPLRLNCVTHTTDNFSKTYIFLLTAYLPHQNLSCGTLIGPLLVVNSFKTCYLSFTREKRCNGLITINEKYLKGDRCIITNIKGSTSKASTCNVFHVIYLIQ